jgi:hypothetical protein
MKNPVRRSGAGLETCNKGIVAGYIFDIFVQAASLATTLYMRPLPPRFGSPVGRGPNTRPLVWRLTSF